MEKTTEKPVTYSQQYALDSDTIFEYGVETFGEIQAINYEDFIDKLTKELNLNYLAYPECRHIPTQSRMYRNIILDSHLIIYRIGYEKIEVLRILHSHSSINKIKGTRHIKI
jgi:toxin ParE1/3/4